MSWNVKCWASTTPTCKAKESFQRKFAQPTRQALACVMRHQSPLPANAHRQNLLAQTLDRSYKCNHQDAWSENGTTNAYETHGLLCCATPPLQNEHGTATIQRQATKSHTCLFLFSSQWAPHLQKTNQPMVQISCHASAGLSVFRNSK